MSKVQDLLNLSRMKTYFELLAEDVDSIEDETERLHVEDVINQILNHEDSTICEKVEAIEEAWGAGLMKLAKAAKAAKAGAAAKGATAAKGFSSTSGKRNAVSAFKKGFLGR
jgi:hypothetical protein